MVEEEHVGQTCPYCQAVLKPQDEVIRCRQCGAAHHKECWDANGGCTTVGCSGQAARIAHATEGHDVSNKESDAEIRYLGRALGAGRRGSSSRRRSVALGAISVMLAVSVIVVGVHCVRNVEVPSSQLLQDPHYWLGLAAPESLSLSEFDYDVQTRLAEAWAKAGDLARAKVTAADMDYSYEHDKVLAYVAIAEVQARTGDKPGSQELFRLALAAAAVVPEEEEEYGRVMAYADIAMSQARLGYYVDAVLTAQAIPEAYYDVDIYKNIIVLQARAGDVDGAKTAASGNQDGFYEAAYEHMAADRCDSDVKEIQEYGSSMVMGNWRGYLECGVCLSLAQVLTEADNTKESQNVVVLARSHADNIISTQVRMEMYLEIAKAQAGMGDFRGAEATAQSISVQYYKLEAAVAICKARAEAGDIIAAMDKAKTIEDRDAKSAAYFAIVIAQAERGEFQGAKATAERITDNNEKAWAYIQIADAQSKTGDVDETRRTLVYARSFASQIVDVGGANQKEACYRDILVIQARIGDAAGAKALAASVEVEYEALRAEIYEAIAFEQEKSGDLSGAMSTISLIIDDELRDSSYGTLAQIRTRAGDFPGAMFVAASLSDERSDRDTIYWIISEAQANAGDITGAKLTAAAIADDSCRPLAYGSICQAQVKMGDYLAAKATATSIAGRIPKEVCFSIAKAQAMAGELRGLADWIEKLPRSEQRVMSYIGAAEGLVEENR